MERSEIEKREYNKYYKERNCPVCGKIFIPAPLHMYKYNGHLPFVCSYNCMLKSERMEKEKKTYKIVRQKGDGENG